MSTSIREMKNVNILHMLVGTRIVRWIHYYYTKDDFVTVYTVYLLAIQILQFTFTTF